MIKAVIIDDEHSARETLSGMLAKFCPEVMIAGMADSAQEGINVIQNYQPQLVFLDVQMPFGSGFDLLEALPNINFEVIFTTAYNQYALKAIKFSALDYLLKPIDVKELKAAVEKVQLQANDQTSNIKLANFIENVNNNDDTTRKIVLPTAKGFSVVAIKDIIRCESDRNYTWIHFRDGPSLLATRSLKDFEELLVEYQFFRVHQSHLINLDCVKHYNRGRGGQVALSDGSQVDVARSKRDEFVKMFL